MSRGLEVHQSVVSRRLRAMEDDALVRMDPAPHDRRSVLVSQTPKGRRELRRLLAFGVKRFQTFLAGWMPDEARQLTALRERFHRATTESGDDGDKTYD